jgi:hypothetical protein
MLPIKWHKPVFMLERWLKPGRFWKNNKNTNSTRQTSTSRTNRKYLSV